MIYYPKIELHCHLDGSLRPETVMELAQKEGLALTADETRENLIAPLYCDSLETYLQRFALPVKLMQSPEALERITFELFEDAAFENVKYLEVRFAPQLHTEKGLDYHQIIQSVISGMKRAEKIHEIKGNVILSYMRNTSVEGIDDLIEAGKAFLGKGVVGLDLCAGERDFFCERFEEAFDKARQLGYHITIHAGETGIVENIVDAVDLLKAERIGHGVAMMYSPETLSYIKSKGVMIESCPTSNVQTKAVESIEEHPFRLFMDQGIALSINTDNRTVSDTSLTGECNLLEKTFQLSEKEYFKVYEMSIEHAFASEEVKAWLKQFLLS